MRKLVGIVLALAGASGLPYQATAQPPERKADAGSVKEKARDFSKSSLVTRMMAFDKNKDGKLTRDEITDARLRRLFDQADADKDGVVTRAELTALAEKLEGEDGGGGPGGPGGPGGRGGFGGPPRPGQLLPPFLRDELKLTAGQTKQLDALQKEVDDRLAKILTAEQKKQLQEMRGGPGGRGPGGPGRGGRGPGGPPGGGPPDR